MSVPLSHVTKPKTKKKTPRIIIGIRVDRDFWFIGRGITIGL
jgi:hypothetical protein